MLEGVIARRDAGRKAHDWKSDRSARQKLICLRIDFDGALDIGRRPEKAMSGGTGVKGHLALFLIQNIGSRRRPGKRREK